jgi:hypothetical protein
LTFLTKAETESELWYARPWAYESAKTSDRGGEVKGKGKTGWGVREEKGRTKIAYEHMKCEASAID